MPQGWTHSHIQRDSCEVLLRTVDVILLGLNNAWDVFSFWNRILKICFFQDQQLTFILLTLNIFFLKTTYFKRSRAKLVFTYWSCFKKQIYNAVTLLLWGMLMLFTLARCHFWQIILALFRTEKWSLCTLFLAKIFKEIWNSYCDS